MGSRAGEETDAFEETQGGVRGVRVAVEPAGQLDILDDGQVRQQIEELENHSDLPAAIENELVLRQTTDLASGDPDLAGGRAVDAPEEVKESRLPTAGRADQGQKLAADDLQVHSVERDDRLGARIDFPQPAARDGRSRGCVGRHDGRICRN
jgi:hypothetical protein